MKTIITKEYINKKINKLINELVNENLENGNNALSNLYSKNIYYMFESIDRYFSFWETTITLLAKQKIDKIENYIYKKGIYENNQAIQKYINRFYK